MNDIKSLNIVAIKGEKGNLLVRLVRVCKDGERAVRDSVLNPYQTDSVISLFFGELELKGLLDKVGFSHNKEMGESPLPGSTISSLKEALAIYI